MENTSAIYHTLITGATAGIGKQIAIECARRKLNLFLVSLPDTGMEELAESLRTQFAVDVKHLSVDLTRYDAPQKVYDFAQKNNLKINMLVNNAGVGFEGKIEEVITELTDKMILLNIRASTLLAILFLPQMMEMKKAHILNVSSFAAFAPIPYKCVYSASKTYLFFLTRALNSELKNTSVKVTSIHPTGVRSKRTLNHIKNSAFMARISSMTPEQVAKVAVKNMLNGKKFIIPGMVTKIYYYFGSMLPHGLILKLAGVVFRKQNN